MFEKIKKLELVYRINLFVTPVALVLFMISGAIEEEKTSNIVFGIGLALILPMGFAVLFKALKGSSQKLDEGAQARRKFILDLASSPLPGSANKYVRLVRGRVLLFLDSVKSFGNPQKSGFHLSNVISKGSLIATSMSEGVSLSSSKEGVIVQVPLLACNIHMGNGAAVYQCTRARYDGSEQMDQLPRLLGFNKPSEPTTDVNYPWMQSTPEIVHDVILGKVINRYQGVNGVNDGKISRHEFQLLRFRPVFYSLENDFFNHYSNLITHLSSVGEDGCWYYREVWENVGIERWKGHAGTRYTTDRRKARILLDSKSDVQFNLNVANLMLGSSSYLLLPDAIVSLAKGKSYPLTSVQIFSDTSQFVLSEGSVPAGSTVIGHTWEYVNRDGSPDLRYSENARKAIIRVTEISAVSDGEVVFSFVIANEYAAHGTVDALVGLTQLGRK